MNKRYILVIFLLGMVLHGAISQIDILTNPEDTSVCPGDTAMFKVNVSLGTDSVRWQYANDSTGPWLPLSFDVNGVETTMLRVHNSQFYSGKYFRIIALDGGVAVDSSGSASLIELVPPMPTIDPSNPMFCMGESATLFAIVGSGPYTYHWNTNATEDSIIVISTGEYLVTVTDGDGCTGTSSASVVVNPLPEPILFTPDPPKICTEGDTTVVLTTISQYVTYLWSTQETSPSITIDSIGTIALTVTNAFGCETIGSRTVTNYPPPSVDITPSMAEFCDGDSISLTAAGGNYTYLWSQGSTNQSIIVKDETIYFVTVTDSDGCQSSDMFAATVNPNPIADFTTNPDELTSIPVQTEILFTDFSTASGTQIETWEWDFGEEAMPPSEIFHAANEDVIVKYLQPGLQRAKLTVTDMKGCMGMDTIIFIVNPSEAPEILLIQTQAAECVGDIVKIQATVTTTEPGSYTVLDSIDWMVSNGIQVGPDVLMSYDPSKLVKMASFIFYEPGEHVIKATGYRRRNANGEIQSGMTMITVNGGSIVPQIEDIVPSSTYLCRGDSLSFDVFISPPEDAEVNYSVNGFLMPLGQAIGGYLRIENVPATMSLNQIILRINSIDLSNGCKNDTLTDSLKIDVRSKPDLIVADSTEACLNSVDTLVATGAVLYEWRENGVTLVSTEPNLPIPADVIQILTYEVIGTTDGCSSVDTAIVKIVAPPNPSILENPTACSGQVIIYKSNSNQVMNLWNAENGNILSSDTGDSVLVLWENSGKLTLIQSAGECIDSTTISVSVSDENSPPYDTLVYLEGGGILLYPNPSLIPDLCYKWYKNGQLLPDTYQGCVVGTNLTEAELSMFSVEVYFCNQGEECAQIITYRAFEEESITTDFQLKVVPNPNHGIFVLEYEITEPGTYIQDIFDSSGRLVQKETIPLETKAGNLNLSLLNAESGIYFIKLINGTTGEYRVVAFSILQ